MKRLSTFLLLGVVGAAGAAAPARAHTLPERAAVKAAKKYATVLAGKTAGSSPEVAACARETRHRWACTLTVAYPADDAACDVPVTISYRKKGHRGRALRREPGATICY